jgi:hypothetical protein
VGGDLDLAVEDPEAGLLDDHRDGLQHRRIEPDGARFRRTTHDDAAFVGQAGEYLA